MSLQLAAQHLAAHGRGKDTELVHMDKGELHALRAMAQGAGGDLTVNPHTGLPEAGFLSNLLPTIAGFALDAAVPGLGEMTGLGAFAAPAIVGGASMLMGGSLQNGLMAGLGAYGGSQLAGSLAAAGGAPMTGGEITAENAQAVQQAQAARDAQLAQASAAAKAVPQTIVDEFGQIQPNSLYGAQPMTGNMASLGASASNPLGSAGLPAPTDFSGRLDAMGRGLSSITQSPSDLMNFAKANKYALAAAAAPGIMGALPSGQSGAGIDKVAAMNTPVPQRYQYTPGVQIQPADVPMVNQMNRNFGSEVMNFQAPNMYTPINASQAKSIYGFADGGSTMGANPVERMSNENAIGANTGFPQAYIHNNAFATPTQTPVSQNVLTGPGDVAVDPYTGEQKMATGGISDAHYNLGGYSDGGRLLRGPGDGVSDSIPATIGHKQPARLADGEFVVPARIVSELGNGSTEAGARKLYAMMDRVQAARKKTVGKNGVAHNSRADKYLPA
jgi:hypothetical protein